MLRLRFISLMLLLLVMIPVLGWADSSLEGNGLPGQQPRILPAFDHILIQGGFTLKVKVSGHSRCTVSGDENLLDQVVTQVDGGELLIAPKTALQFKQPMEISLEVAELTGVTADGAHRIEIDDVLCPVFVLTLDGACSVRLSGFASLLEAELSGVSTLEAQDLEACEATISAHGTAVAKVQVKKSLGVHATGIAEILYRGEPELTEVNLTGRARVASME
nr:DUF2807 domain-containing protein [uncultured Desulfuromonas sp.]